MTITWHGQTCFRIESDGKTLIINPPAKSTGLKRPKGTADVIIFSEDTTPKADWAAIKTPESIIVNSPGEYDLKGFFILGLAGSNNKLPNIFIIEHERKTICHIVDYPKDMLDDKDLEKLGKIDILMIPVGKNADRAARITNQIEPSIVIPMHYDIPGIKEKLASPKTFMKELGASNGEERKKLIIKKKETFSNEGTEVIILTPQ